MVRLFFEVLAVFAFNRTCIFWLLWWYLFGLLKKEVSFLLIRFTVGYDLGSDIRVSLTDVVEPFIYRIPL